MKNHAILIVNWNSWVYLARCLAALSRQSNRDFRVLVADNASDQAPPEEVFSILPDMEFIQNDINYGFAEANNRLIEIVNDSPWIILLNPDAYPEPDWFEQLTLAAQNNKAYSFFACRQLMANNPSKLDGQGDSYHISGYASRNDFGQPLLLQCSEAEVFSPCAAAAMYKTKKVLQVGGFDNDYFCYFEDVDLGFRLRLIGEKCLLVPTAVVHHQGSASTGGQHSDFSAYYGHRNIVWTYLKNMPGILFWLFLPYHLLLNLFSIIWLGSRGQGKVLFRAKRDALADLAKILEKRAAIQANRKVKLLDILRVLNTSLIPKTANYLEPK